MFSVIINNFNYAQYLGESIESVLRQSSNDLQLIIVDDGSADQSSEVIRQYNDTRIVYLQKANGGQLSCFHAALPHIQGDLVAFLDADDVFYPRYLETLLPLYQSGDIDFLFTNYDLFGAVTQQGVKPDRDIFFPVSRLLTCVSRSWIGGPTSTLSMRTALLRKFLPLYDIEPFWKIRADDILVWGASLCGARKYYLHEPLVGYRVHDSNRFYHRPYSAIQARRHAQDFDIFVRYFDIGDKTVSAAEIRAEMAAARIPLRYYAPYLVENRIYTKILRRLLAWYNRHCDDVYTRLII